MMNIPSFLKNFILQKNTLLLGRAFFTYLFNVNILNFKKQTTWRDSPCQMNLLATKKSILYLNLTFVSYN